jgi:RNA polymerase sigma-70 factor (ECF subfamily)
MASASDAQLVRQTRSGDKAAYAELVARYQGHVYGLAYSLVDGWADAQDIAQETFVRAYCNLDQLRHPSRFAAWLRRVATAVTINWIKAFRPGLLEHLGGLDDLERLDVADFEPGPPEVVAKRDLAEAVLRAVASLPPKYRVPLTMFHLGGLSYEKVAEFLDVPLGTAKSLIHRARRKLRPILSAYMGEEAIAMVGEVFEGHKLPGEFARKVIDSVPVLGWGRGRECTFIGALEAALSVTDCPYTYAQMMSWSGLAFRVRWWRWEGEPMWCPSTPVGEFPEEVQAVSRATGWRFRDVEHMREKKPDMARYAPEIVASLDAGVPVIGYPTADDLNVAVIFGYEEGGKQFVWRNYFRGEEPQVLPASETGPWLLFLEEHVEPPPPRDALLEALRLAVRHWERECGPEPGGPYRYGAATYDHWIADLEHADSFTEEQRGSLFFMNWWNYSQLEDAREAAVGFLTGSTQVLDGGGREALAAATALYAEERDLLAAPFAARDASFGPWSSKSIADWSPEVRRCECKILAQARDLEARAVAEITKVLAEAE